MNSVQALQAIRTLMSLIELMQSMNLDAVEVTTAIQNARAEGRELTDAELEGFANDAQSAIDAARDA